MSNKENYRPSASPATGAQQRGHLEPGFRITSGGPGGCSLGPPATSGSSNEPRGRQHRLKQRFSVIRKLGKGTYGKVQLAVNKQTGQEVAIKTIKKSKIENEQDLERVKREIQIMSSIEHPHIIHIYEVFENDDKIVLIMQYAPGGELYEYVSKFTQLDDNEARRIFRQIATALYYCHSNKICHRDLKLENILLDEKQNARIADFGLSNIFDKHQQLQTFCGSPLYASPEIVRGCPYEGPEVDCWSLGVLLYTLVYGAMPFDGSNFKRLVRNISEASYPEPKPRSLASPLIRRLLCADPTKRATIIDICTDSWVNGAMLGAAHALPSEPAANHASLLQVAMDMAKLTPVRLDILRALKPVEPSTTNTNKSTSTTCQPEPEVPISQVESNIHMNVESGERNARDDNTPEIKIDKHSSTLEPVAFKEMSLTSSQHAPVLESQLAIMSSVEMNDQYQSEVSMNKPEVNSIEQVPVQTSDEVIIDTRPIQPWQEFVVKNETLDLSEEKHQTIAAPEAADEHEHVPDIDTKLELAQDDNTDVIVIQQDEFLLRPQMDLDSMMIESDELVASSDRQQGVGLMDTDTDNDKTESLGKAIEASTSTSSEQKPKKVVKPKKKVIVKRRKKAQTPTSAASSQEVEARSTSIDDQASSSRELQPTTGARSRSGSVSPAITLAGRKPGKVQIPETFTCAGAAASSGDDEDVAQSKRSTECRRQSAMIADVANRLIQQQIADATAIVSSGVRLADDQGQLMNAMVAVKKDEFERRASIVAAEAAASTPPITSSMSASRPSLMVAQVPIEETEIKDLEEGDTTPTMPQARSPNDNDGHRRPSRELERLIALEQSAEQSSLVAQEPLAVRDDRSDSVETIRPSAIELEESLTQQPVEAASSSIKSHFEIELAPRLDRSFEAAATAASAAPLATARSPSKGSIAPVAPAPIARSYKKVTFTNDGARITETARIYSSQTEDGRLRHIERKSKITDYPTMVSSDGFTKVATSGSSRHQKHTSVQKDTSGTGCSSSVEASHQSSWTFSQSSSSSGSGAAPATTSLYPNSQTNPMSSRAFEKLIMPTSSHGDMMPTHGESIFQSQSQRVSDQSAATNRRDSASSCSSESTDIFDDIFDTWTGAMSMFERGANFHSPFASSSHQHHGDHRHHHHRHHPHHHHHHHPHPLHHHDRSNASLSSHAAHRDVDDVTMRMLDGQSRLINCPLHIQMQNSRHLRQSTEWLASDRPASAFGLKSPRAPEFEPQSQLNMDNMNLDPLNINMNMNVMSPFGGHIEDRMRDIQSRHEQLRRQMAGHLQHKHFWKGSTPSLFSPQSTVFNQRNNTEPQQAQGRQTPTQRPDVHSSESEMPARRNTANISELLSRVPSGSTVTVHRTTSRSSMISNQLASMSLNVDPSGEPIRQLNNTSSNSWSKDTGNQATSSWTKADISNLSSSHNNNNIEDDELRDASLSSFNLQISGTSEEVGNVSAFRDNDARVQNWLQESGTNLSSSSGSKSSFSTSANDPFNHLYGSLRSSPIGVVGGQSGPHEFSVLPPKPPRGGCGATSLTPEFTKLICDRASASSVQQRMSELAEQQHQAATTSSSMSFVCAQKSSSSTKVQSSQSHQAMMSGPKFDKPFNEQELDEDVDTDRLNWIKTTESSASRFAMSSGAGDESPGSGNTESSSSLLDQLKSRGYRSMMNERLGTDIQQQQQSKPSSSQVVTSSSSAGNKVSTTTTTCVITCSSTSSAAKTATSSTNAIKQAVDDPVCKDEDSGIGNPEDSQLNSSIMAMDNMQQATSAEPSAKDPMQEPDVVTNTYKPQNDVKQTDVLDDDVKEAKANIQTYLDRMKETDKFIKSVQKEEETNDRQRRESFMLNNLIIANKINGIRNFLGSNGIKPLEPFQQPIKSAMDSMYATTAQNGFVTSGFMSAPLGGHQTSTCGHHPINHHQYHSYDSPSTNEFDATTFTPNYNISSCPITSITSNTIASQLASSQQNHYFSQTFGTKSANTSRFYDDLNSYDIKPKVRPMLNRFSMSSFEPTTNLTDDLDDDLMFSPSKPLIASSYDRSRHHSRASRFSANLGRQTTDDFVLASTARMRPRRPLSVSIDSSDLSTSRINYKPRLSTLGLSSRPSGDGSQYTTEYQSAFSKHQQATTTTSASYNSDMSASNTEALAKAKDCFTAYNDQGHQDDDDDDEDHSMGSYRASAYVPKVVPDPVPFRKFPRRASSTCRNWSTSRPSSDQPSSVDRRTSLNVNIDVNGESPNETPNVYKRRSMTSEFMKIDESAHHSTQRSMNDNNDSNNNSRLTDLEQRIQANRKRREQLLATDWNSTSFDDKNDASSALAQTEKHRQSAQTRDATDEPSEFPARQTRASRSSRLESVEERIKRRSYYVRVSDTNGDESK